MSNKSAKPAKKLSVPRDMADIQKEAQTAYLEAGQLQYSVMVYENQLKQLNDRILTLNHEASARNQLDAEKRSDEALTTQEVKNA